MWGVDENVFEDESRCFYTPTRSVRINPTQNNDPCTSRNTCIPLNPTRGLTSEQKTRCVY